MLSSYYRWYSSIKRDEEEKNLSVLSNERLLPRLFCSCFKIAKALHKERRECEHGEWALFRWAYL